MNKTLSYEEIIVAYPKLKFKESSKFMWSPTTNTIYYKKSSQENLTETSIYSLLHEIGHALENHQDYQVDVELIILERAAWARAELEAHKLGIDIDEDHIESAMDTYRDWLLKRARCPDCEIAGIQADNSDYTCLNCTLTWQVPLDSRCVVRRRPIASRK